MTNKVNALPQSQFVAIWNNAGSLDEAIAQIQVLAGLPCPRWAVIARALTYRKDGIELKRFPEPSTKVAG